MITHKEMTFSKTKQLAALGHAISSEEGWNLVTRYVQDPAWFTEVGAAVTIFTIASDFVKANHRSPSLDELQSDRKWVEDAPLATLMDKTVASAVDAARTIDVQILAADLLRFRQVAMYKAGIEASASQFDALNLDEAFALGRQTFAAIDGLDPSQATYSADLGIDQGLATIETIREKLIYCGFPFLDEPMGGILPDDLIVVSSPTGQGKTALMALLARSFASQGRKVKFLALEAGDNEIEMRILFGDLMAARRAATNRIGGLDFGEWKRGEHPDLVAKYGADVIPKTKAILKNISITYKKTSKYGTAEIERDIAAVKKSGVDVVIIDHLHYIDRDPKTTETEAIDRIMKKIRDINLQLKIPIILAAHVKKEQEAMRFHTLLPGLKDIYGSGSISKVATIVLALTQPGTTEEDKFPADALYDLGHGWPTLVRFLKTRDYSAGRSKFTIVPFYSGGKYGTPYVLGRSSKADTVWTESRDGIPWAKSRVFMPQKINNNPAPKGTEK